MSTSGITTSNAKTTAELCSVTTTQPKKKPGDLAIHVRVGRAFEKLGQLPQAIEEYKAAQKLTGPQKWSEEAKSALVRLQPVTGS